MNMKRNYERYRLLKEMINEFLEHQANPVIKKRGYQYYQAKRIQESWTHDGIHYHGLVEGSDMYHVSLDVYHNHFITDCSCPYDETCKHEIALMYAILDDHIEFKSHYQEDDLDEVYALKEQFITQMEPLFGIAINDELLNKVDLFDGLNPDEHPEVLSGAFEKLNQIMARINPNYASVDQDDDETAYEDDDDLDYDENFMEEDEFFDEEDEVDDWDIDQPRHTTYDFEQVLMMVREFITVIKDHDDWDERKKIIALFELADEIMLYYDFMHYEHLINVLHIIAEIMTPFVKNNETLIQQFFVRNAQLVLIDTFYTRIYYNLLKQHGADYVLGLSYVLLHLLYMNEMNYVIGTTLTENLEVLIYTELLWSDNLDYQTMLTQLLSKSQRLRFMYINDMVALEKYEKAIYCYETYSSFIDKDHKTLRQVALAYQDIGDEVRAQKILKKVFVLSPTLELFDQIKTSFSKHKWKEDATKIVMKAMKSYRRNEIERICTTYELDDCLFEFVTVYNQAIFSKHFDLFHTKMPLKLKEWLITRIHLNLIHSGNRSQYQRVMKDIMLLSKVDEAANDLHQLYLSIKTQYRGRKALIEELDKTFQMINLK